MKFNILNDLKDLFLPPVCPVCGRLIPEGAKTICNSCRINAPLTGFCSQFDNPVVRKFWGIIPVVNASSFLFFVHGNGFRDLIHDFKYAGHWKLALEIGRWYGGELARSGLYNDVDIVIPVPLHYRRRLKRGYNQSEYIARGISKVLGTKLDTHSIIRHKYNQSQTRQNVHERWKNVRGIFSVRHPERLRNKHILLVDDVLTTGSTLISCAETILRAVPDARISIATLAVSRSHIEEA